MNGRLFVSEIIFESKSNNKTNFIFFYEKIDSVLPTPIINKSSNSIKLFTYVNKMQSGQQTFLSFSCNV